MRPSGLLRKAGFSYATGADLRWSVIVKLAIKNAGGSAGTGVPLAHWRKPYRALLLLVVVERLPESNPDIKQAQAAAQAAEEAIGNY